LPLGSMIEVFGSCHTFLGCMQAERSTPMNSHVVVEADSIERAVGADSSTLQAEVDTQIGVAAVHDSVSQWEVDSTVQVPALSTFLVQGVDRHNVQEEAGTTSLVLEDVL
jgi:hypothetical protein